MFVTRADGIGSGGRSVDIGALSGLVTTAPTSAAQAAAALNDQMRSATTAGTQDGTGKRLVKIVLSGALAVLDRLPGRAPLADRAAGVVLLYHDVPVAESARFARQLDMLLRAGIPMACDALPRQPDGRWHVGVTFDDGLLSFSHVALPELQSRLIPSTMFAISGLLRCSDHDITPTHEGMPVMTKAAIAELPAAGHEVGSHTEHHARLSRLDDAETLEELCNSRAQLEAMTGEPVVALAFPYGDWSLRTLEIAVEAGYERVFSVLPDLIGRPDADPVLIGRIVVAPTDWPIETWLKLRGAYRWVARWGHYKARLAGHR